MNSCWSIARRNDKGDFRCHRQLWINVLQYSILNKFLCICPLGVFWPKRDLIVPTTASIKGITLISRGDQSVFQISMIAIFETSTALITENRLSYFEWFRTRLIVYQELGPLHEEWTSSTESKGYRGDLGLGHSLHHLRCKYVSKVDNADL